MADSEPSQDKDEPTAAASPRGADITAHNEPTNGNAGSKEGVMVQEQEIDDFGLPVKTIKRPSTSSIEDGQASEDGELQLSSNGQHVETTSNPKESLAVQDNALPDPKSDEHRYEKAKAETELPAYDQADPSSPADSKQFVQGKDNTTAVAPQIVDNLLHGGATGGASAYSHQALAPHKPEQHQEQREEWQDMPAFAPYDIYNDDGKLIAREANDSDDEGNAYKGLGGAGKGYTRVQIDEDAQSATSMDENTDYLFKPKGTDLVDEDEQRDPLAQLQATKNLLTEGQRIAYVGVTRLAMAKMVKELDDIRGTRKTKKGLTIAAESMKMWSQQMMVRLYMHMDIDSSGMIYISSNSCICTKN